MKNQVAPCFLDDVDRDFLGRTFLVTNNNSGLIHRALIRVTAILPPLIPGSKFRLQGSDGRSVNVYDDSKIVER